MAATIQTFSGTRATARKAESRPPVPLFHSGDFTGEIEMRWQDIENKREKYDAYLCSREWSEKKQAVHQRANGICERCRLYPIDAVHHKTYARQFDELLEDLEGHCQRCHDFTHAKSDSDPREYPRDVKTVGGRIVCPHCGSDSLVISSEPNINHPFDRTIEISIQVYCTEGHSFGIQIYNDYLAGDVLLIAHNVQDLSGT